MRAAAILCALLLGCGPDRHALVLDITAESDVRTLVVRVTKLARGTPPSIEAGRAPLTIPIDRREAEIAAEPIHLLLAVPRGDVMVHLLGEAPNGARTVATRCYRVNGVDRDAVRLILIESADLDFDGFLSEPPACLEPDGSACDFACPAAIALDCDDRPRCAADDAGCLPPETVHPGAIERCEDGIDQDCSGADTPCIDDDRDGHPLCRAASPPGSCDCDDQDPEIHPGVDDCAGGRDGIDADCNGSECCDEDLDGLCADRPRGGAPDCDDTTDVVSPVARELCSADDAPRVDENCNGLIDELAECVGDDLDRDGFDACAVAAAPCDCDDCDPGVHPGIGLDRCGDGIDQDCSGADAACDGASDPDGDGFPVESGGCESDPERGPMTAERCDGVDQDCDAVVDEVVAPDASTGCLVGSSTVEGCEGGRPCEVRFRDNLFHCGGCRRTCNGELTVALACVDGVCECPGEPGVGPCTDGASCCPAGCRDLGRDPSSCGSCGNDCDALPRERGGGGRSDGCTAGDCTCGGGAVCGLDERCCGGCIPRCGDAHCGACGSICGPGGTCETAGDSCGCRCAGSLADCNGDSPSPGSDGCEVDTLTDPLHCGGCGRPCALTGTAVHACEAGRCRAVECAEGWKDCDGDPTNGCERNIRSPSDCGDCDVPCRTPNAVPTCETGECRIRYCDYGFGECDGMHENGCETSTRSITNCGACGITCVLPRATARCPDLLCVVDRCEAGFANCDLYDDNGCETELATDHENCGRCENPCGLTETCVASRCI